MADKQVDEVGEGGQAFAGLGAEADDASSRRRCSSHIQQHPGRAATYQSAPHDSSNVPAVES